jgi:hypothetical protein
MSWRLPLFLVLLLSAVALPAAAQSRPAPKDADAVITLERNWEAAFLGGNIPFIERVLAEEFKAVYWDGSEGDRTKELTLAAQFNQRIEKSTLAEFTVRFYSEVAIVSFTRTLAGISQGKPLEISYRFTDAFVWRDDRWQCISTHSTRLASGA